MKAFLGGLAVGIGCAVSVGLIASTVDLPNNFTAGTPARAAEVNANFSAVKSAVDDNHARLSTLEAAALSQEELDLLPRTWSRQLPDDQRFQLVFGDQAVLDRETGLVWQRAPSSDLLGFGSSAGYCAESVTGGRRGWRLPHSGELLSLMVADFAPFADVTLLPEGHPFIFGAGGAGFYWTVTPFLSGTVIVANFRTGFPISRPTTGAAASYWCVRGPGQ